MQEIVLVIDFGGQYNQLIARRVRELGVYAEILPYTADAVRILSFNPVGIIFTGGPNSVYAEGAHQVRPRDIRFGHSYPRYLLWRAIIEPASRRSGDPRSDTWSTAKPPSFILMNPNCFGTYPRRAFCWMSHTDYVQTPPGDFKTTASTKACPYAAFENVDLKQYGVQFHPEVVHTQHGNVILKNFLYDVCEAKGGWDMKNYSQIAIDALENEMRRQKGFGWRFQAAWIPRWRRYCLTKPSARI